MQITVTETDDYQTGATLLAGHQVANAVDTWVAAIQTRLKQTGCEEFVIRLNKIILSVLNQYGTHYDLPLRWQNEMIRYCQNINHLMPRNKKKRAAFQPVRAALYQQLAMSHYQRARYYRLRDKLEDALNDTREAYRSYSEQLKCLPENRTQARWWALAQQSLTASYGCFIALLAQNHHKAKLYYQQAASTAAECKKLTDQPSSSLVLEMQYAINLLAPTRDICNNKPAQSAAIKRANDTTQTILNNKRNGVVYDYIQFEELYLILRLYRAYVEKTRLTHTTNPHPEFQRIVFASTELCLDMTADPELNEHHATEQSKFVQLSQDYGEHPICADIRCTLLVASGMNHLKSMAFAQAYPPIQQALALSLEASTSIQLEVRLNSLFLAILDRNSTLCQQLIEPIPGLFEALSPTLTYPAQRTNKYFQIRDILETLGDLTQHALSVTKRVPERQPWYTLLLSSYQSLVSISLSISAYCQKSDPGSLKHIRLANYRDTLKTYQTLPELNQTESRLDIKPLLNGYCATPMPSVALGRYTHHHELMQMIQRRIETPEAYPNLSQDVLLIADLLLSENRHCLADQTESFNPEAREQGAIPRRLTANSAIHQRIQYKEAFILLATLADHLDPQCAQHPLGALLSGVNALQREDYTTAQKTFRATLSPLMQNDEISTLQDIAYFIWSCIDYTTHANHPSAAWSQFITDHCDYLLEWMLNHSESFPTQIAHYQTILATTTYQLARKYYQEKQFQPALQTFLVARTHFKTQLYFATNVLKHPEGETHSAFIDRVSSDLFIGKCLHHLGQLDDAIQAFTRIDAACSEHPREQLDLRAYQTTSQFYHQLLTTCQNPSKLDNFALASLVGKIHGIAHGRLSLQHTACNELIDNCTQLRETLLSLCQRDEHADNTYLPRFIISLYESEQRLLSLSQEAAAPAIGRYQALCQFLRARNQSPNTEATAIHNLTLSQHAQQEGCLDEAKRLAQLAYEAFNEKPDDIARLEARIRLLYLDILDRNLGALPKQMTSLLPLFSTIADEGNPETIAHIFPKVDLVLRYVMAYCDLERQTRNQQSSHFYHAHLILITATDTLMRAIDISKSSKAAEDQRIAPMLTITQMDTLVDITKEMTAIIIQLDQAKQLKPPLELAGGDLTWLDYWTHATDRVEQQVHRLPENGALSSEDYLSLIKALQFAKKIRHQIQVHLDQQGYYCEYSIIKLSKHDVDATDIIKQSRRMMEHIKGIRSQLDLAQKKLYHALCASTTQLPYFYQYGTFYYGGIQPHLCRSLSERNLIEFVQVEQDDSQAKSAPLSRKM